MSISDQLFEILKCVIFAFGILVVIGLGLLMLTMIVFEIFTKEKQD